MLTLAPTVEDVVTVWEAQPGPQAAFVGCPVFEILFGGARGGGKTDAVLGEWALHADEYRADAIGLMVRRTRIELLETYERARLIYTKLGATFTQNPMRVVMPNGARLTFAYLERDADAEQYQGASYTRVYIEEAGNFPSPVPIMKLMATLRSGAGVPTGIRLTGNPGGPGHQWVRARYIDPEPMGWKIIRSAEGLQRIYIPSRVGDNRYLGADYVQRLRASGSPELVRAWLEGDWSVVSGAFFPEFSMDRHVIAPRALPEHWLRFRSFDWGSARPFACHWWAVSDGSVHDIARGALVNYREWYGMKPNEPNVGLRLTAEAIAAGIKAREADDPAPMTGVADPAMFAEDGGPSIAQRMIGAGVIFRPADNKRVAGRGAMGGWDQVRARLEGDADGRPMMLLFSTSRDLIRTLPALQHDDARPEDVDSDMEDHAPDSCFVGSTRIATRRGRVRIDRVRVGDLALTREGYRLVTAAFTNGEQPVLRIGLSDGSTLTGTANHPVWVEGEGFVSLSSLRQGDIMQPSWLSSSSAQRSKSSEVSDTIVAAPTFSTKASVCIGLFGRISTVVSHAGRTFTTAITTLPITSQAIWSAPSPSITSPIMADYGPGRQPPAWTSTRGPLPWRGTDRRLVERGIGNIWQRIAQRFTAANLWPATNVASPSTGCRTEAGSAQTPVSQSGAVGSNSMWFSEPVSPAHGHSGRANTRISGIVRWLARRRGNTSGLAVVSEPTPAGTQRVYNLSVDGAEEYFANGVLVHNCRYACMSRPFVRDVVVKPVLDTWAQAFQRASSAGEPQGWRVA